MQIFEEFFLSFYHKMVVFDKSERENINNNFYDITFFSSLHWTLLSRIPLKKISSVAVLLLLSFPRVFRFCLVHSRVRFVVLYFFIADDLVAIKNLLKRVKNGARLRQRNDIFHVQLYYTRSIINHMNSSCFRCSGERWRKNN